MAEESGLVSSQLTAGIESLMKTTTSSPAEILTELLKFLAECVKEFTTKLIAVVSDAVENIYELGRKQFAITLEAKTVCRELLAMLTCLTAYLKKVENFAWHAGREERKATVLEALRQEKPNSEPLNGYLKQLGRCLERAEASFKEFKDRCDDNIMKTLSIAHEECKSTANKAKLAEAITKGAGGAFSALSMVAGVGAGGTVAVTGIALSLAAGVPTLGIGTVIGLSVTGTVAPIVGLAVGGSAAGLTHMIATEFKGKKKALILLGICIGEIEETASSVQHIAGKVQVELKDITEQIDDIEFFMSDQVSQMESMEKLFEELKKFATIFSECHRGLLSKQQELENSIFKVIGS